MSISWQRPAQDRAITEHPSDRYSRIDRGQRGYGHSRSCHRDRRPPGRRSAGGLPAVGHFFDRPRRKLRAHPHRIPHRARRATPWLLQRRRQAICDRYRLLAERRYARRGAGAAPRSGPYRGGEQPRASVRGRLCRELWKSRGTLFGPEALVRGNRLATVARTLGRTNSAEPTSLMMRAARYSLDRPRSHCYQTHEE